jgi:hypothetical protein
MIELGPGIPPRVDGARLGGCGLGLAPIDKVEEGG